MSMPGDAKGDIKMQYLLSQEEFDNLVPKQKLIATDKAIEILQFYAEKQVKCWQLKKDNKYDEYCDDCPLSRLRHKDFIEALVSVTPCSRNQSFSK